MIIPYEKLNPKALSGLIEEFVTRDGTDSGYTQRTLDENMAMVRDQIKRGQAFIVFDPMSNTCNIVQKDYLKNHQKELLIMTQTVEKTIEDIIQDSKEMEKKIFLVEIRVDWSGSSHIIAPIIKKIENQFRHLIEVKRINLESNKKSLTEICSEFVPSVVFIRDGIVLELLNGTFSKKSIEKILLNLLDGSDV